MTIGAMNRVDFEAEKRLITRNGWPSYGDNLIGMSQDVDWVLATIDDLDEDSVDVNRTTDADRLIEASCACKRNIELSVAAEAVESAWLTELRYRERHAHVLTVGRELAVLEGITQIAPQSFYVTVRILVRASAMAPAP